MARLSRPGCLVKYQDGTGYNNGLAAQARLALAFIRQMNRVNSWNDLSDDDSTINIVQCIIIIVISSIIIIPANGHPSE